MRGFFFFGPATGRKLRGKLGLGRGLAWTRRQDLQGRSETTPLIAGRLSESGANSLPFFPVFHPPFCLLHRAACFLRPYQRGSGCVRGLAEVVGGAGSRARDLLRPSGRSRGASRLRRPNRCFCRPLIKIVSGKPAVSAWPFHPRDRVAVPRTSPLRLLAFLKCYGYSSSSPPPSRSLLTMCRVPIPAVRVPARVVMSEI